uniref:Reverse transcriptase domain-containing protein n=1 Tax=Oreochromis aureus TaxID=47969 RepID=A0A668UNX4_OREAU
MDRIFRGSQVAEGFHLGGLRISSLLFLDDVVLLASSGDGLQLAFEQFAADFEAVGMGISTSKSRGGLGFSAQKPRLLWTWVGEIQRCCLLGAGVLGEGLGALGHGVLGQFTGQQEAHGGLDLRGGKP